MGLYVPLDVNFPDDEKIMEVGIEGAGLYAMALCIAKRLMSDGKIKSNHLLRLGASQDLIDTLIAADLVRADVSGTLQIVAWLDHNESVETIEAKRSKDAQRKRVTRTKRPRGQDADVQSDGSTASATVKGSEVERSEEKRSEETELAFDEFWSVYPKRNGKRIGKQTSLTIWSRLNAQDRSLVLIAAKHYADAVNARATIAKDPERFLRGDWWKNWTDPAVPDRKPARSSEHADSIVNAIRTRSEQIALPAVVNQ